MERLLAFLGRQQARSCAGALIAEFGSLGSIFAASGIALRRVTNDVAAVRHLKSVRSALRIVTAEAIDRRPLIGSRSALNAYLMLRHAHLSVEHFRVLFLSRERRLIRDQTLHHGTIDEAAAYPREILRRAIELHASGIILVHNHPSGDPTPSRADLDLTRAIMVAGQGIGLTVYDHLIVTRSEVSSMREAGLL